MQENFRTQAFGFHKKDVVNYIYELTREKEENEKAASAQIEALATERDALRAERDRIQAIKEALEEQVHTLKAELTDANMQKSRVSEEINQCRRTILDNEREFNIKNEQISKLIAENEDYAQKCEKYADIARDVGKTIMEAKRMAAEIVDRARGQAEEIRENTRRVVADTLHRIDGAQTDLETLRSNVADMNRACENRLHTIDLNLKGLSAAVRAAGEEPVDAESVPPVDGGDGGDDSRTFF